MKAHMTVDEFREALPTESEIEERLGQSLAEVRLLRQLLRLAKSGRSTLSSKTVLPPFEKDRQP